MGTFITRGTLYERYKRHIGIMGGFCKERLNVLDGLGRRRGRVLLEMTATPSAGHSVKRWFDGWGPGSQGLRGLGPRHLAPA